MSFRHAFKAHPREKGNQSEQSPNGSQNSLATMPTPKSSSDKTSSEPSIEEPHGLFELWPATPIGEVARITTTIDVVAIHGLGGGAYSTWSSGERLWLRDFLPVSIPNARILTFGYNANLAFGRSASTIEDYALSLLSYLRALRRRTGSDFTRKMIFVCHSLGGIVLKQALITAHNMQDQFGWVNGCNAGIIFMGTPHRGSDVAYWSGLLAKMVNVPTFGLVRSELLQDLEPKSRVLGNICGLFVERAKAAPIYTFYERRRIKGLSDLIVDEHSAILHLPNETPIPLELDHREMCKYLTASSQPYSLVLDAIFDLAERGETQGLQQTLNRYEGIFLNRLDSVNHEIVIESVDDRWRGASCSWLINDERFVRWRQDHETRLLWLYGPPGIGKTVMAKYVINRLRALPDSQSESRSDITNCLAFFFCSDKVSGRNSEEDILGSLIFQILGNENSLFTHVDPRFRQNSTQLVEFLSVPKPKVQDLWQILRSISQKARNYQFWLVLDAIDELQSEVLDQILTGFARIFRDDIIGRVKVAVTSRHEHFHQQKHRLNLDPLYIPLGNSITREDVEYLIVAEVDELMRKVNSRTVLSAKSLRKSLETGVKRVSDGNFLLAKLALASLSDFGMESTPRALHDRLQSLDATTPDLESHYHALLKRIPENNRPLVKSVIMWVLVTQEHLRPEQLCFNVSVKAVHRSVSDVLKDIDNGFMERICAECGYLITVGKEGYVRFAHQSVKDLLVDRRVSEVDEELRLFTVSTRDAHFHVSRICVWIFAWPMFTKSWEPQLLRDLQKLHNAHRSAREVKRMLLQLGIHAHVLYFLQHWIAHFQGARGNTSLTKVITKLAKSSHANVLRFLSSPFLEDTFFQTVPTAREAVIPWTESPLNFILHAGDFPEAIQALLVDANSHGLQGSSINPISLAVIKNRKQSLQSLIEVNALPIYSRTKEQDMPLHFAVRWLRLDMLDTLIHRSDVDMNAQGGGGLMPLQIALQMYLQASTLPPHPLLHTTEAIFLQDTEAAIAKLFEADYRIDVRATSTSGKTLWQTAMELSSPQFVVQLLLHMRIPPTIDRRDFPTKTFAVKAGSINFLQWAGLNGWTAVEVDIIRDNPQEAFMLNGDRMNALSQYAYLGRKSRLQRLLDALEPSSWPSGVCMPNDLHLLHLCAHQNWEDVVRTLIRDFHVADIDSDHMRRTLLHWAADYSWSLDSITLSSKSESWLNQQDRDGLTALHIAVINRNQGLIKSLLDRGVSMLLKEKRGYNPVHLAADEGYTAALRIFFEKEVGTFGRTNELETMLHLLAKWERRETLEEFYGTRFLDINAQDRHFRTPLHYAAVFGNLSAATFLLDNGARPHAIDLNRCTPLHLALREGHVEITQLLLCRGANTDETDGRKQTCLHLAIRSGSLETFRIIAARTQSVNKTDSLGKTALHRACAVGNAEIITEVIRMNADINSIDDVGQTPLHIVASNGKIAAVQAFLDVTVGKVLLFSEADDHGRTPMDWPLFHQDFPMVAMLEERGGVFSNHPLARFGAEVPYNQSYIGEHLQDGPDRALIVIEAKAPALYAGEEHVSPEASQKEPGIQTAKKQVKKKATRLRGEPKDEQAQVVRGSRGTQKNTCLLQ